MGTEIIKRIAIVNRSETAVRLIRAAREFNAEHNHSIRTIALHADPERRAVRPPSRREGHPAAQRHHQPVPRPRRTRAR
ncbi:biotin carboxylase N-terminal domain-containing protein [Nocardia sp. NBC_00565]|uniref:biotin carboxylase N-terminal domain-containing protein n=1 Tax=Nocardia sp. NBC_00565 TaxID=2975993 RepID=UPI003FA5F1BB